MKDPGNSILTGIFIILVPIYLGYLSIKEMQKNSSKLENSVKDSCQCPKEMGINLKSKLIECYDIDRDGDLDCIYKQDSTQKTILYQNYDNGSGYLWAGELYEGDKK